MTADNENSPEDRTIQTLEEICENTRAIRRVVNRILDHLHQHTEADEPDYDPDTVTWNDLYGNDDMYL